MSTDDLTHRLTALGIPREEARAYLYLVRAGDSSAAALAKGLGISRPAAYRVLETLARDGFALAHLGRPRTYGAVPAQVLFKMLELRGNALLERIGQARLELVPLLEAGQAATAGEPRGAHFAILNNAEAILSQAQALCHQARRSIDLVATPVGGLDLLRSRDVVATLAARARHGVPVRVLAEGQSPELDGLLSNLKPNAGRSAPPGVLATSIVADRAHALVVVTGARGAGTGTEPALALRTNVAHFVAMQSFLFDGVWKGAPQVARQPPRHPATPCHALPRRGRL